MAGFPGCDHPSTHWSQLRPQGSGVAELKRTRQYFYERYALVVFKFFRWKLGFKEQDDLDDLVHEFFVFAFEKELTGRADHQRGRFRVFLRIAAESFLLDHHKN